MAAYEEIERSILMKHLTRAYLEHLTLYYQHLGYETYTDYKILPDLQVDFAARKNESLVVVEIKSGPFSKAKRELVKRMRNYLTHSASKVEVRLAFLNPPSEKEILFDEIDALILDNMLTENFPDELDQLSTHTAIEEVSDVELYSITIKKDDVFIEGSGTVTVILRWGSESDREADEGAEAMQSYRFNFSLTLTRDFEIEESEYEVDTDPFYE